MQDDPSFCTPDCRGPQVRALAIVATVTAVVLLMWMPYRSADPPHLPWRAVKPTRSWPRWRSAPSGLHDAVIADDDMPSTRMRQRRYCYLKLCRTGMGRAPSTQRCAGENGGRHGRGPDAHALITAIPSGTRLARLTETCRSAALRRHGHNNSGSTLREAALSAARGRLLGRADPGTGGCWDGESTDNHRRADRTVTDRQAGPGCRPAHDAGIHRRGPCQRGADSDAAEHRGGPQ